MVMELVEGEDLQSRSRRGRIAMPMLMDFATQVLGALDYAHARGVVHRDIKPASIMVSLAGLVKVLDFGIAIAPGSVDLTMSGSFIGPIAKIVVARLANQYTDLDRLYAEASKQIDNDADRKKFLSTRPPAQ